MEQKYKFSNGFIGTEQEYVEKHTPNGIKEQEEPAVQFNRIKWNRMTSEEQIEFERRRNEKIKRYYAVYENGSMRISKRTFDFLNNEVKTHEEE